MRRVVLLALVLPSLMLPEALARGNAGDACGFRKPRCKRGLECDGSSHKCAHTPRWLGEGCGALDRCKPELLCSGSAGRKHCVDARRDAGQSCTGAGRGNCKPGLECDGSSRKCAHTPRWLGEGCGALDPCKPELLCSGSAGRKHCVDARRDARQSCTGAGQGTCKPGLECDGSSRKCAHTPRWLGEGCGALDPCKPELLCSGSAGRKRCIDGRRDAGQSCTGVRQGTCKTGLQCDGWSRRCAHVPRLEGEGCGALNKCATGLACAGPARKKLCTAPKDAGETCHSLDGTIPGVRSECKTGLECDTTTRKCSHVPRQLNEGCGLIAECSFDLTCATSGSGFKCGPRFGVGKLCGTNRDCGLDLACRTYWDRQRRRPTRACMTKEDSAALTDERCRRSYDPGSARIAKKMRSAQTWGLGAAASGGVSGVVVTGVVYGEHGQYGCFRAMCLGAETDANVNVFASTGVYNRFKDVAGTSTVVTESVEVPGIELGYSASQVFASGGTRLIGSEMALAGGVGVSPVAAGTYSCKTTVTTVSP